MLVATGHGACWGDYHLADDNCHPNDQGHEIWADAVFMSLVTSKNNLVGYLKLSQNNCRPWASPKHSVGCIF